MLNNRPHKRLLVWQKSIDLVSKIYEGTSRLPSDELYGLKSQMRRASVSVPSNIAEGLTRRSPKDKAHFLNISQASLSELDTQLEIALRLKYIETKYFDSIQLDIVEVQKLLSGLSRSIDVRPQ